MGFELCCIARLVYGVPRQNGVAAWLYHLISSMIPFTPMHGANLRMQIIHEIQVQAEPACMRPIALLAVVLGKKKTSSQHKSRKAQNKKVDKMKRQAFSVPP